VAIADSTRKVPAEIRIAHSTARTPQANHATGVRRFRSRKPGDEAGFVERQPGTAQFLDPVEHLEGDPELLLVRRLRLEEQVVVERRAALQPVEGRREVVGQPDLDGGCQLDLVALGQPCRHAGSQLDDRVGQRHQDGPHALA